jgi:hypothetical protein
VVVDTSGGAGVGDETGVVVDTSGGAGVGDETGLVHVVDTSGGAGVGDETGVVVDMSGDGDEADKDSGLALSVSGADEDDGNDDSKHVSSVSGADEDDEDDGDDDSKDASSVSGADEDDGDDGDDDSKDASSVSGADEDDGDDGDDDSKDASSVSGADEDDGNDDSKHVPSVSGADDDDEDDGNDKRDLSGSGFVSSKSTRHRERIGKRRKRGKLTMRRSITTVDNESAHDVSKRSGEKEGGIGRKRQRNEDEIGEIEDVNSDRRKKAKTNHNTTASSLAGLNRSNDSDTVLGGGEKKLGGERRESSGGKSTQSIGMGDGDDNTPADDGDAFNCMYDKVTAELDHLSDEPLELNDFLDFVDRQMSFMQNIAGTLRNQYGIQERECVEVKCLLKNLLHFENLIHCEGDNRVCWRLLVRLYRYMVGMAPMRRKVETQTVIQRVQQFLDDQHTKERGPGGGLGKRYCHDNRELNGTPTIMKVIYLFQMSYDVSSSEDHSLLYNMQGSSARTSAFDETSPRPSRYAPVEMRSRHGGHVMLSPVEMPFAGLDLNDTEPRVTNRVGSRVATVPAERFYPAQNGRP